MPCFSIEVIFFPVTSFKLHDRATHVFSEANRVLQFKKICDMKPVDASEALGKLMNDSHASCRDLYECSCDDLDRLVSICRYADEFRLSLNTCTCINVV